MLEAARGARNENGWRNGEEQTEKAIFARERNTKSPAKIFHMLIQEIVLDSKRYYATAQILT
jgi:hypothetical protein